MTTNLADVRHPPAAVNPLDSLRAARADLAAAEVHVCDAAAELTAARHKRAIELHEKLLDAIAFIRRLEFVVEGDERAAQAGTV
jgi:hypothetical protein